MCRVHIDPLLGFSIDPATEDASAWEHKRMRAVVTDDSKFKIAVERRRRYCLPLHIKNYLALHSQRFDLDQINEKSVLVGTRIYSEPFSYTWAVSFAFLRNSEWA